MIRAESVVNPEAFAPCLSFQQARSSERGWDMESAVDSPRNQSFHWHGSARSYFRIGLTLGDNIVDLLTP